MKQTFILDVGGKNRIEVRKEDYEFLAGGFKTIKEEDKP